MENNTNVHYIIRLYITDTSIRSIKPSYMFTHLHIIILMISFESGNLIS